MSAALSCPPTETAASAQPAGVQPAAPSDAELKKAAGDLEKVSLLKAAGGFRAVAQFQNWGTAARAATPYVLPLLQHKKAGNPVAEWRDGKVVLIKPEDIVVEEKQK